MTISPCKDCPDRNSICHTVCERYKEWQGQIKEGYKQKCQSCEVEAYEIRRSRRLNNWKRSKK